MKKVVLGIILALLLMNTLAVAFNFASVGGEGQSLTRVEKAVNFLINYQFNQSLGLCREAPNVKPNTYWLVSDNLWAWKALTIANESGISGAIEAGRLAGLIEAKLKEKAEIHDLPTDPDGFPVSFMHEAVIGDIIPTPNRTCTPIPLQNNGYQVLTEICNGTVINDWMNYSDRLLYTALTCHWQGNDTAASYYFELAKTMWDGIGINDTATRINGFYATYKLALLLYASKVLGAKLPFEFDLIKKIYSQQRETDGGIITDYYLSGKPVEYADANTETTSIVIIALLTPPRTTIVPYDYLTIQEAINAANPGDTIYVKNGIYHEHVSVNKDNLTLIGEDRSVTFIDGDNTIRCLIEIMADNVIVSEFTIRNAEATGIRLYQSQNTTIYGNYITNNKQIGISIGHSNGNRIYNNTITGHGFGYNMPGIFIWGDSHNNNVMFNKITNNNRGIELGEGNYGIPHTNVVSYNLISDNEDEGIKLYQSNNNIINNNTIIDNDEAGIYLYESSGNSVENNNITKNGGVYLVRSFGNSIVNNSVSDSYRGIYLSCGSSGNVLTFNKMNNNKYNFGITADYPVSVTHFYNDINTSNVINGKPIYYWVNVMNKEIPSDAGYVAVINSVNVTINGLNLTNNYQSILLAFTSRSVIRNVDVSNNVHGIDLVSSHCNIIYDSVFVSNSEGIAMGISGGGSNENIIRHNLMFNNRYGIYLTESSENTIKENEIVNAYKGISVSGDHNVIYHNNFKNNTIHAEEGLGSTGNIWDNNYPSGGNYWDDYVGVDRDNDGIGDYPYSFAGNNDNFPLIAPINIFEAGTFNNLTYYIDIISNSSTSDFYFNPNDGAFLKFNVTGENGTSGFCRVTIPADLLWVEDGWIITVGDQQITNYTIIPDENFTYLYFTYNHSTQTVTIQGTGVIPEFPSYIALLGLLMLITISLTFAKKKRFKKRRHRLSFPFLYLPNLSTLKSISAYIS
ncbi:hypothetical protein DRO69_11145 [Candidatus Bathyarchaeota archaeon]|nr:MAG: hypothetical protein DRO69_11145 [Candidatus Bathyarchaeota archaeon]